MLSGVFGQWRFSGCLSHSVLPGAGASQELATCLVGVDVACLLPVVSSRRDISAWQLSASTCPYRCYMSPFLPFSKVFVFGTVTEWLHFYNKWLYCCLWIVNGLLQSTGWPCVVAVMGNWFGKAGYAASFLFHFSLQMVLTLDYSDLSVNWIPPTPPTSFILES